LPRRRPAPGGSDIIVQSVNSLTPYTQLLVVNGQLNKAKELLKKYHYRRWEGGGSIYDYWVYLHLMKAHAALNEGKAENASFFLISESEQQMCIFPYHLVNKDPAFVHPVNTREGIQGNINGIPDTSCFN